VTFILCVDQLLEPASGPTWFPFDRTVLYEIHVDNNTAAVADISFQFRFTTLPIAGAHSMGSPFPRRRARIWRSELSLS
jgi:hypothetical protein